MITKDVRVAIESADHKDSKEILYLHLKQNANVETLLEYAEVAISATAHSNTQTLGRKLKEELRRGGWLSGVFCFCECT